MASRRSVASRITRGSIRFELHDDEYWDDNARRVFAENCEQAARSNTNIRFSNFKGRPFYSLMECMRRRRRVEPRDFDPDTPNLHQMEPIREMTDAVIDEFINDSWMMLSQEDYYWVAVLKTQFWLVNGENRGWTLAERSSVAAGQRLIARLQTFIPALEHYMWSNYFVAKPWLIPDDDFSEIAKAQHFRENIAWSVSFKFELTKSTFRRIRMGRSLAETPRTHFPEDDRIRVSMEQAEIQLNRMI